MGRKSFRLQMVLLVILTLLPGCGRSGGAWISLNEADSLSVRSKDTAPYSGDIRISFLGDCTLGGQESRRRSGLGFEKRIEQNGYDFPFRNLKKLTASDDLTIANLEGVLSDRKLKKEPKKYNFIGPSDYARILTSGSIECVTLANNHSHDYGEEGYSDTKAALEAEGIAWFGTESPVIWQNDEGLMIGFLGVNYSLTGDRYKRFREQAQALKEIGCAAVITVMHAGTEYSYTPPDDFQRQITERAVKCGSCLIIGHHPHVVQGVSLTDGIPVVYSLGNCSFGGTTHAKDSDALMVQAVLSFEKGTLKDLKLHFYPISITSDERYNNYSPRFLTGEDAVRVLKKMEKSTGMNPGEWDETEGAIVTVTLDDPLRPSEEDRPDA